MKRSCKGFTLIELMITITIIAILTVIAVVSYQSVQKKARDGRREADLKVIQGALQQYYADNNSFPSSLNALTASPNPTSPYLKSLPIETVSGHAPYWYQAQPVNCSGSACSDYCLASALEIIPSSNSCLVNLPTQQPYPIQYNYGVTHP